MTLQQIEIKEYINALSNLLNLMLYLHSYISIQAIGNSGNGNQKWKMEN